MTDTPTVPARPAPPHDPVMAAPDPAMFAPMTREENQVLNAHLQSGWAKQRVVYPILSEPWRETTAMIDDLHLAWRASWQAEHGDLEAGS
jgi:hypothetical protein